MQFPRIGRVLDFPRRVFDVVRIGVTVHLVEFWKIVFAKMGFLAARSRRNGAVCACQVPKS